MLGGQEPSEPRSPSQETEGRPEGALGGAGGSGSRPGREGFKFGPSHNPSFRRLRLPSLCLRRLLAVSPTLTCGRPRLSGGRPRPGPRRSFSALCPPPPKRGSTATPMDTHGLAPSPQPRALPGSPDPWGGTSKARPAPHGPSPAWPWPPEAGGERDRSGAPLHPASTLPPRSRLPQPLRPAAPPSAPPSHRPRTGVECPSRGDPLVEGGPAPRREKRSARRWGRHRRRAWRGRPRARPARGVGAPPDSVR